MSTSETVAIIDDPRFDDHRDRSGHHPECPERLEAARDGLMGVVPKDQQLRVSARRATDTELSRVHPQEHLRQLRSTLAGGWGHVDPDTFFSPGSEEAAWLAAGGAVDLTRSLMAGQAHHGIALLRPPGHHAEPSTSMGFCLINNVAVAAHAALAEGAKRVAVVDWDVHHGNGTQAAFYDDPRVMFVSLHQYPFYPGTGAPQEIGSGAGKGYTANIALPANSGPETYGDAFRRVVLPLLSRFKPDLLLVSAGFDAHDRDPLAQMHLGADSYQAMAASLMSAARETDAGLAFLLEGGYDLAALEDSVAAVARALLGQTLDLPQGDVPAIERRAVDETLRHLEDTWHLTEG